MILLVYLVYLVYLVPSVFGAFIPDIHMPYTPVSGAEVSSSVLETTLTCDEQRNSLWDCAMECYNKTNQGSRCPGFYTDTTQTSTCFICHVSSKTEIQNSNYRTFQTNDKLYLLRTNPDVPDVAMTFDSHSGNQINGTGTVGTTSNVVDSYYVPGVRNSALYLHGGGKVALTGSNSSCWTNIERCTSGMTFSIWYKPVVFNVHNFLFGSTAYGLYGGFMCVIDGNRGIPHFRTMTPGGQYYVETSTSMALNQWYLLTLVYLPNLGISIGMNGILERTDSTAGVFTSSGTPDWRAHIGVRHQPPYTHEEVNGVVDEFKLHFRNLNPAEIWREYVGYTFDLDLPAVLPAPGLVTNGNNNYNNLLDGNLATCVNTNTSCNQPFKVKIWNSASDITNYTITVTTHNIPCHRSNLMVYGAADVPDYQTSATNSDSRSHFLGSYDLIHLERMTSGTNGVNECMFRHICPHSSYFVTISVPKVPDGSSSVGICEVKFD